MAAPGLDRLRKGRPARVREIGDELVTVELEDGTEAELPRETAGEWWGG
jgi:hypothetical protein